MKKVPTYVLPPENITLLAVSPEEADRQSLQIILDEVGWTVHSAQTVREATSLVTDRPTVVLCAKDLPDGSWKDVFRITERLACPPPVVVASHHADEQFWAEVLNLGCYDVLLKPFRRNEVSRVLDMACRHARQQAPASAYALA